MKIPQITNQSFILVAAITIGFGGTPLLADFSYDQTAQMTGGSLLQMMRFASKFSKDSRSMTEPILTTVSIQGNRMVRKTPVEATVIDLDKQTFTRISFADKVYSVTTFEQLKQQMAAMAEKMHSQNTQQQPAPTFDVKIEETGQKKDINGSSTNEVKMLITVSAKDASSGSQGAMNMVNDMWIAPHVSGYDEVRDFHKRMAETLGWVPGENPMLSRPDTAKAMAEMYRAGAKLDGMPMASTVRMGADVQGQPTASDSSQAKHDTQNSAPPPTSVGGALAGALGGRFGMGRHKKDSDSDSSSAPNGNSSQSDAALLEFTTQVTSYNSAAVDSAVFQIPAGFSQVQEDLMKPRKSR